MPELKFEAIKKQIENKEFSPLYLFHGDESYFIDQLVAQIEKTALPEEQKAFNQTVVYGKDIGKGLGKIIDLSMRLPMMAEKQVVIIKEAQHLSEWDKLIPYIKNPTPSTILVFAHKHKKLDGRSSFTKEIKKQGVVLTTKRLKDYEMPKVIENMIRVAGYTINPKATQLLVEFLGTDLSKVSNELNKLFLVQKDNQISPADIEENIGISKDFNVFELQNAFMIKDHKKVFQILNYFKQNPKAGNIVFVISMLASTFSRLYTLFNFRGQNDQEMAKKLGVNPYFIKDYKIGLKNYSLLKLHNNIGLLHEYDLRSKGVGNANVNPNELMKELAIQLLNE